MALRGGAATLEISTDGNAWTDISEATLGLDGFDTTEEEGTVELGGGGTRTGMQTTGYVVASSSFTVDENDATRPILTGYNGETLHVRYRREGAGVGNPQMVASGPVTVSHSFGERDKRRYSVDMQMDGAPTRTTQ